MNYEAKYLKYKNKYLELKRQSGGDNGLKLFIDRNDFLKMYL